MTNTLTRQAAAKQPAVPDQRRSKSWGYGRVSTENQTEGQQRAALEAAGCHEIVTETISSGKKERPGLRRVMDQLEAGDTLVICKLDRWARSLQELLAMSAELDAKGVNLQVLDQQIDTSTAAGRLLFQMLGAVAEFERSLAIQRTHDSVAHRRASGGNLGGRPKSYTPQQQALGLKLRADGQSISQIAAQLGLAKGTCHRMLQAQEAGH